MKNFWKGFATLYVIMALIHGFSAYLRIPAVNAYGGIYYGVFWPVWPTSVALNTPIIPIPTWAFTFD